ncbi:MAG TPA: GNAT family N-acetyltransferase [Oxalobacteraceae bacterium]|jgi:ElaA protein|nr:GNAT family N-acetyltransferase [Oxalobacteraceae bacterium]
MIDWQWSPFEELSRDDLYAVLARRQQVFIMEQNCVYQDVDGLDQHAMHLLGWRHEAAGRELVAYLRCVLPGGKFDELSLGRVLCAPSVRGTGVGKQLFAEGIRRVELQFPGQRIRISAQQYLESFYRSFGFEVTSAPYSEDGIAHVEMRR